MYNGKYRAGGCSSMRPLLSGWARQKRGSLRVRSKPAILAPNRQHALYRGEL